MKRAELNTLPTSIQEADISKWVNIEPQDFEEKSYLKTIYNNYKEANKNNDRKEILIYEANIQTLEKQT